jgi:DNA-binding NarL/FixJ family response regulator
LFQEEESAGAPGISQVARGARHEKAALLKHPNPLPMPRIALVEDNANLRLSLAELVQSVPGLECIATYASGEEALTSIPQLAIDLVIMDISLALMSGIECTARLKERLPDLKILILTTCNDAERIFDALKAGASGYILKRGKPESIIDAIHEILEGGAPMTPEIALRVVESFRSPMVRERELPNLTPRESEVLRCLVRGMTNKEAAVTLSITEQTVRWYLKLVYEKLDVRTRTEAVVKFLGVSGMINEF